MRAGTYIPYLSKPEIEGDFCLVNPAARRNAWRALIGVTLAEAGALVWSFYGASWARVLHYALFPPANTAAWVCAAGITIAYIAYAMYGLSFVGNHALSPAAWRGFGGLKAFAVVMALVTGFFEEAFFRRFIMDWAMHAGESPAAQIIVSAALFGAVHGVWALFGGIRAGVGATLSTGVLGGLLAATYIVGGRSLLPCAASHIVINLVIEPWLILAATSGIWGRSQA